MFCSAACNNSHIDAALPISAGQTLSLTSCSWPSPRAGAWPLSASCCSWMLMNLLQGADARLHELQLPLQLQNLRICISCWPWAMLCHVELIFRRLEGHGGPAALPRRCRCQAALLLLLLVVETQCCTLAGLGGYGHAHVPLHGRHVWWTADRVAVKCWQTMCDLAGTTLQCIGS